jgi:hypothetical protein
LLIWAGDGHLASSPFLEAEVACMSLVREAEITPDIRWMLPLINYFGKIRGVFEEKKMLEKYERSRYVYENKQISVKTSEKNSDI